MGIIVKNGIYYGGVEVPDQADWEETSTSASSYIKNKPELGTASSKDTTTLITSGNTNVPTSEAVYNSLTGKVDKVSGKGLSTNDYTTVEKNKLSGIASGAEVNVQSNWSESNSNSDAFILNKPTKVSDFTNDTGFITNTVSNLTNYYTTSNTYTKTEVDSLIAAAKNGRFEVVATLPTTDIKTNVIYLVPKTVAQTDNIYDEYVNLDATPNGWEKIGDTEIDLTGYIQGSGTNGYIAKFNGTGTITNGPQLGSATNTYLRNDGSWAVPPNDNTTYSFANGTNGFTVTPSGGSAQTVTVTPNIDVATTSSNGLMSATDKTKLNGISSNANKIVKTQYTLSASSWVQNPSFPDRYSYILLINNPMLDINYPINIYLAEEKSSSNPYEISTKQAIFNKIYAGYYPSSSVEDYPSTLTLYYSDIFAFEAPSQNINIYIEGVVYNG